MKKIYNLAVVVIQCVLVGVGIAYTGHYALTLYEMVGHYLFHGLEYSDVLLDVGDVVVMMVSIVVIPGIWLVFHDSVCLGRSYKKDKKETMPSCDDPCPDCGGTPVADIFGRHKPECRWGDKAMWE